MTEIHSLKELYGAKVFAVGAGPGPKNVGLELVDGRRLVTTYRNYKVLLAEQG